MIRPKFLIQSVLSAGICLGGVNLVGCSEHSRSSHVDHAETLTAGDGRGGSVRATAPEHGEMFVLDSTDNRLLWSGAVNSGDEVAVDARANVVTHNGKTVAETKMPGPDRYVIKFYRPH